MTATPPITSNFDETWRQFADQRTTADENAFLAYRQMRERKSSFLAFLIPVTSTAAVEATRPVRESLTQAGIADAIPSHYFHITVLPLCLAADLPAGGIARVMDRTSRALRGYQPVRLSLRGVNSFASAAFVEVHDERDGLAGIRDALRVSLERANIPGFGADEREQNPMFAAPYLPHMSICYYRESYPTAAVGAALEPYRDTEIGSLRVDTITLAAIPYSDYDRFPEITRIADLLLA